MEDGIWCEQTNFRRDIPIKNGHPSDRGFVLCLLCQNKDLYLPLSVSLHELGITGAVSNDSTLISA